MTINVRSELVAIDTIQPHPKNPRMGDIAAIAESLQVNGQYSPIVVWNDIIIAGTHTWKAAKSLGWKEVAITRFEGNEDEALRVLITDNRTSDIASYDNALLLDLMRTLPNLDGTGYDQNYLDELDGVFSDPSGGGVSKPLVEDGEEKEPANPIIKFGKAFVGELDPTLHDIWLSSIKDAVGEKKGKIANEVRERLALPNEPKVKKETKVGKASESKLSMVETETVSLSELKRFPSNPREGDIGAITESLRILGQYRPIVVNKRNNQILKGNHTAAAASALGWTEIAVVWVDVDDEQAARIVLADNRIADKATYDNELLVTAVSALKSLDGSGFDSEDLADLSKGKDSQPNGIKVKFQIGDVKFSVTEGIFMTWLEETELPDEALSRLGLPPSALLRSETD